MTSATSPLGRFGAPPGGGDGAGEPLVTVRLLGLPLRVLAASRERHDDLMREFRLLALSGGLPEASAPSRLTELTGILGRRFGSATARPSAEIDAALERGDLTVDLTYQVPAQAADAAVALEQLMAEADEFCATEQLMTLERSPVLKDFAGWYLGQFVGQIQGRPAARWTGPVQP